MDVYHPATELVGLPPLPRHRVFRPRALLGRRHRRGLNLLLAFLGGLALGLWLFSLSPTCATLSLVRESRAAGRPKPPASHNATREAQGDSRGLLFVGVMTARKYLGTRAVAVHETWGRELPGRLAFFSSEASTPPPSKPTLPLVSLKGVDDSYPPQKKSFLMLQHMWEEYGSRFEWFMRADDDVYVRGDKVGAFLRSVDSSKPLFIGQAGRGNQEEFGLLSLEYDENFCMGGPGVILSRETLARVAPHIKHCLKNLYTTHEDVELGRCVQKFAGIPCTWSYEMQTIFYHNSSGSKAFTGNLKQKEVHRAITLHPVKQYQHMYRIHNYMKMLRIQEFLQERIHLHRDIYGMGRLIEEASIKVEPLLPDSYKPIYRDSTLIGQPPCLKKYNTSSQKDLIPWSFIQRSLYSADSVNPRKRVDAPLREGLDDVIREVMDLINMFSKQRGRVIDFKEILYGYHRHNPLYGAEYILDLLLVYRKYRGRKMTVPVRRHAYFQQQFTGLSMREVVEGEEVGGGTEEGGLSWANLPSLLLLPSTENSGSSSSSLSNKLIHFILPLSGRFHTFKRFLLNFEEVCLRASERVQLTVVLFQNPHENSFHQAEELITALQADYKDVRISLIPVYEDFARAHALQLGAAHAGSPDDLLFFIDVDIVFREGVLQRVRANTVRGKWVYFPIVFSEFDPKFVYALNASPHHFTFNDAAGYWRQYGFGIGSIYKTDLEKVGGFNVGIKGWGKEDVDLFEKFINATPPLKILRAPDPDLVHVFHPAECDPTLEEPQLRMCLATRSDTYGNTPQLASFIVKDKKLSRLLGLAVT